MKYRDILVIAALTCGMIGGNAVAGDSQSDNENKAKHVTEFPAEPGKAYVGEFTKNPPETRKSTEDDDDFLPEVPPPWRLSPYKSRGFLAVEGITFAPEEQVGRRIPAQIAL